jgi:Cdc6-like AAA superfamily ATPase
MPWNPPSLSTLVPAQLELWKQAKQELSKKGIHNRFEVDYELRFMLFVAENIDGLSQREEKNFSKEISKSFDWSAFHLKMLDERIFRQPSFDLEQLRICREILPLGQLAYQLALCMCLVDADLSQDEKKFLKNLRQVLWAEDPSQWTPIDGQITQLFGIQNEHQDFFTWNEDGSPHVDSTELAPKEDVKDCLAELEKLTGLGTVKDEIKRLVSFLDIQQQRQKHDLPQAQLNHHMVFTGSPGTGKTTVARLVARIYRALGILKKGHLTETDRSGLVGQYIGHTEVKTNNIINKALDGILFIDEAYALVKESENDFGNEAIDTLVKRMEDDRHRLVVIVAGYEQEMNQFLEANTGLKSRFNTFIPFEDYQPIELVEIFHLLCNKHHYSLDDGASEALENIFKQAISESGDSFGNARYARNLFEASLRYQAFRLSQVEGQSLTKEDLMSLRASDLLQGSGLKG